MSCYDWLYSPPNPLFLPTILLTYPAPSSKLGDDVVEREHWLLRVRLARKWVARRNGDAHQKHNACTGMRRR